MKLTEQSWEEFLVWLKRARSLSVIYSPDYYSIKLWQEYESSKRRSK